MLLFCMLGSVTIFDKTSKVAPTTFCFSLFQLKDFDYITKGLEATFAIFMCPNIIK